ncbi:hypothetical protein B0H19DRAFT_1262451 [Mycena capillaripes]|nr:hypothetical protein B0H19DRAFT_1262451 [Mycena capillaripes]
MSATHFDGCDAVQKAQLEQAFKDAAQLGSKGVAINFNWMAALEFFAPPGLIDEGTRKIIQNNFARAAAYQPKSDDWLKNLCVHLTCNDPARLCSSTTTSYHVSPESEPYQLLNFCPLFFTQRTLDEAVQYAMENPQRKYDRRNYDRNHGLISLHEIMHISAVGQPQIDDITATWNGREYGAIGSTYCKYLAQNNEGDNLAQTARNDEARSS